MAGLELGLDGAGIVVDKYRGLKIGADLRTTVVRGVCVWCRACAGEAVFGVGRCGVGCGMFFMIFNGMTVRCALGVCVGVLCIFYRYLCSIHVV